MTVAMNKSDSPVIKPVALIAGPTASGKSALALALAERVSGTIINADASQLYSDLRILSARPSDEEVARVPHRLFGVLDGADSCSAARWAEMAKAELAACWSRGGLPILVGGTGLYIRTLLDGIAPIPDIDPDIRAQVRAMTVYDSYGALLRDDPEAAGRLNPNDTTRVARALEVVRSTGRPLSAWQAARTGGIENRIDLAPMILLPPREALYARCDARFERMIELGAVEEVKALLERKLNPSLPVMRAIGVPEIMDWLSGGIDRTAMIERATIATRRYAKRQYTWFTHQPPKDWQREFDLLDFTNLDIIVIKLQYKCLTQ
jgi:tRNA dimethylallyltransferase